MKRIGVAIFGQTVYHRAAGIAEIHDFGRLVDGLAGGIVDGLTQHLDIEMAAE